MGQITCLTGDKKRVSRGIIGAILIVTLTLTGCGGTSSKKKAVSPTKEQNEVSTECTPVPTLKQYSGEELKKADVADFKGYEKKLAITKTQREAFIEKYGEEDYKYALYSTVQNCDVTENLNPRVAYDVEIKELEEKYHCTNTVIKVPSSIGDYSIGADYLCIDNDKKRDTVVMIHGFGQSRRHNLGVTEKFLKLGYNVIQYDQRGGGENPAPRIVIGPTLEAEDAKDILAYTNEQIPEHNKLVLWGLSYGGGTAGIALGDKKTDDIVDYAILDCPADETISKAQSKSLPYTNELLKIICNKTLVDCNTTKNLKKASTPILFLTSRMDDSVSCETVINMYHKAPSKKKYIFISKKAKHGLLFTTESKKYDSLLKKFLTDKM